MTSYTSGFAQNVTRNYVVTQDNGQGEVGPYYFSQATVDTWYNANKSKITKLGRIYIVPGASSGSTFHDVVSGSNGATRLGGSGYTPSINERKTLKDLGREVIIGNSVDTRLLVLRLIQIYSPSTGAATDPDSRVYIVVENNCEDLGGNGGRFAVRVARI